MDPEGASLMFRVVFPDLMGGPEQTTTLRNREHAVQLVAYLRAEAEQFGADPDNVHMEEE
jgi:acetyl esterase/lipase